MLIFHEDTFPVKLGKYIFIRWYWERRWSSKMHVTEGHRENFDWTEFFRRLKKTIDVIIELKLLKGLQNIGVHIRGNTDKNRHGNNTSMYLIYNNMCNTLCIRLVMLITLSMANGHYAIIWIILTQKIWNWFYNATKFYIVYFI